MLVNKKEVKEVRVAEEEEEEEEEKLKINPHYTME